MMNTNESNFTQEITLPSHGLLNPEIPEGKLVQRCMMVSDQKFLSGSNQAPGIALQQLLQRTTTSPDSFDISKLTPMDTLYLLFKLRILSYGEKYKFKTRCPECGKKIELTVDLSELPVEELAENFTDKLVVELPHRKDKVYTKILTNKDLDEISSELNRRKRRNAEDESDYILRIVYSIEKIVLKEEKKELTHIIDIERYISALTDMDAAAIISARDSANYGIVPVMEHVCPSCKNYIDVNMQFSGDFFRPNFN